MCQILLLKVRERLLFDSLGIQPGAIKVLHADEHDGKEERDEQRKGARRRFQRAANDNAPVTAREMLQHHEAQRAERQAENEHKTHQVGLVEKPGGTHRPENRDEQGDAAHSERALLQTADALRRPIFLRGH